jgi:hypothetical protein
MSSEEIIELIPNAIICNGDIITYADEQIYPDKILIRLNVGERTDDDTFKYINTKELKHIAIYGTNTEYCNHILKHLTHQISILCHSTLIYVSDICIKRYDRHLLCCNWVPAQLPKYISSLNIFSRCSHIDLRKYKYLHAFRCFGDCNISILSHTLSYIMMENVPHGQLPTTTEHLSIYPYSGDDVIPINLDNLMRGNIYTISINLQNNEIDKTIEIGNTLESINFLNIRMTSNIKGTTLLNNIKKYRKTLLTCIYLDSGNYILNKEPIDHFMQSIHNTHIELKKIIFDYYLPIFS